MQNLVNDTPTPKRNYEFVDAIRCIAMISIVAEHSIFFDEHIYHPTDTLSNAVFATFVQLVKFGTINFFLLAGFLIGEKFTDYSPLEYLNRRVKNTFIPWVFWSLFFLAIMVGTDFLSAYRFNNGHLDRNYSENLIDHLKAIYLYSNYWFIPNFLCCITVLLIFRKYLYSYFFGAILLFFTSIYVINIYGQWIEARHSTAILGFVFFLWLGAQFNRTLASIENWLKKTPVFIWILAAIIAIVCGVKESLLLKSMHSVDPYNSLRISNIFYSLICFFLFLRIKSFKLVNYLKPRETTYGIYLIHFILVAMVLPEIFRPIKYEVTNLPLPVLVGYQILRFVIVYSVTFIIIRLINATRFKWLIGR